MNVTSLNNSKSLVIGVYSSAPMSGAKKYLPSPSISVIIPTGVPAESANKPKVICKSVFELNNGSPSNELALKEGFAFCQANKLP